MLNYILIISSLVKFLIALFPIILFQYIDEIPKSGLLVTKFFSLNISPFLILFFAYIDFLTNFKFFFSDLVSFFILEPKEISTFLIF